MFFDTIAAASTPPGMAALGIIRLSGPDAAAICDKLFKPFSNFPLPSAMVPYTMAYGSWRDKSGRELDKVILSAFRAPQSYTGEDLYEITFHGGGQVRRSILESLFEVGARPAEPGEFSKRAFLNGKMDLMEAEAVMDLIEAESGLEQEQALREMGGSLSQTVDKLQGKLLTVMARLENILEFSEEDAEESDYTFLSTEISGLRAEIELALSGWSQGRILRDAYKVSILGLANAGKSTLLNALMGEERAIVSDISGTTRDTLEAKVQFDGIPVLITDTAGLRETDDVIEQEGVKRAVKAAQAADFIIWLHDPEHIIDSVITFREFSRELPLGKPVLHILGKRDLYDSNFHIKELWHDFGRENVLFWTKDDSSLLEPIRQKVVAAFKELGNQSANQVLIHNLRHKELLERAAESLQLAEESLANDAALDATAAMLRSAEEALSSLSGSQISDKLVDEIFSRFCVGK